MTNEQIIQVAEDKYNIQLIEAGDSLVIPCVLDDPEHNVFKEAQAFKDILKSIGIEPRGKIYPVRYRYSGFANKGLGGWRVVRRDWSKWTEGKGAKYGILWERRV